MEVLVGGPNYTATQFNAGEGSRFIARAEFLGVVLESLRQTGRGVRDAGCHALFWDEQRRTLGGTRLKPKPERQAMALLAAFLKDQALLHGFVLVGSACHVACVLGYVVPSAA